ncbi:MAG TPA: DUF6526 family protein [Candidatus Angelobacter sp.]|nr:DUF6526 family protein [Candidatus Angelobacter sp.]
MPKNSQTFANHKRSDPLFHFFMVPVAVISVITAAVRLVRFPSLGNGWLVVVALAALVAVFKIRLYALRVQDRVIRLEERLRLTAVLKDPLRSRIGELTGSQLIALRFASDAELPRLVELALQEKLSRAEIKKSVIDWRPDYSRI